MSFDLDPIYTKFQRYAIDKVGDKLSVDAGGIPNVYRRKDPNPVGKYPFITVNMTAIEKQGRAIYEYYDDNEDRVTATLWDILLTYGVVSNNNTTHSAHQIALDLSSSLCTRDALCMFQELGELVEVFSISTGDTKRNNEVVEVASFNVRFTVYSEETNLSPTVNTMIVDYSERYLGSDEDVASTTITATKP